MQKILKENLEANVKSASNNNNNSTQRNRARKSGTTAAKLHSPSPLRNTRARNQAENNNNNKSADPGTGNITFVPLDWETDSSATLKRPTAGSPRRYRHRSSDPSSPPEDGNDHGFDLVLACDCIYNEALVAPFLSTCADICRLRPAMPFSENESARRRPTVCIIAQQLRSHDVFEEWVREALVDFRVWRVDDGVLGKKLGSGSGYAVHALLLRGD